MREKRPIGKSRLHDVPVTELPPHLKFKDTEQEYIPVVDAPDFDMAEMCGGKYKIISVSEMRDTLMVGDLINCEGVLYSVLENRRHGVVVQYSALHSPMLYEWRSVSPVFIYIDLLLRMGFTKSHSKAQFNGKILLGMRGLYEYPLDYGLKLYFSFSQNVAIIGDILLPGKIYLFHELQHLVYGITRDRLSRAITRLVVSNNKKKAFNHEGYLIAKRVKTPDRYDTLRLDKGQHFYKNYVEKRRYTKKKVITPDGYKFIKKGKGTYHALNDHDRKFMEDNPEYFNGIEGKEEE